MAEEIPRGTNTIDEPPGVTEPWATPPATDPGEPDRPPKRPIHQRWWFWVIAILLLLLAVFAALGDDASGEHIYPPGDRQIVQSPVPGDNAFPLLSGG